MIHLRTAILPIVVFMMVSTISFGQGASREKSLTSNGDGFPIHVTYFPAQKNSDGDTLLDAPLVVILPDQKESRLAWNKGSSARGADPFPVALQKRGYAVITVDLRKHGESLLDDKKEDIRPDDWPKMVLGDMVAVKEFIQEEHQNQRLNMRKMAIVGSGTAAAVAAAFAEYDWKRKPYDDAPLAAERTPRGQDVQALILLSPSSGEGKLRTNRSVSFLKNPNMEIALQIIVGQEDDANYRTANTLNRSFAIKANEDRSSFLEPKIKAAGLNLMRIAPRAAYDPMLKFLDDQLKSRDIPWKDRRSRLER